ncbi:eukaryotic translation elongation factor 1 epsilon-1 isoform X2 [Vespula pensylvanica]|uniref:eukaryotic translation elongation factor 1 epsilon-1 isoform X2 n=1 Tax=Vespula pensylvanica TaxID=30213 RepID=UPI001CB9F4D8|nr:eukaryotic translation elongation factor 1 epsilon-1 isoform X2 [Vespula pensylvanica]
MVVCNVECVDKIIKYLDVSPDKLRFCENNITNINNLQADESVTYFSTLIQTLVKNSIYPDILGNDKETQALTRQWLEYIIICINYADTSAHAKRVLKELNVALSDHTYLSGTKRTIADIALYYTLYKIMSELSHQEKAQYVHVSRWFDNVQQDKKLRQTLDLISFNLMHLFL